ncbi:MAG: FKBP-type peptidyl-prolyl cis-trans isomerase N-terminal domain-containing protein, partial [Haliea sp.]|nr:FKBP-type peptidyl-prolyl cis-trans isomerase N-terminal domain-containing protein [Haliea sp.]
MPLHPEVELATDEQKVSYGFGLQFGDQLLRNDFPGMELDAVIAGLQHWYHERQSLLADGELNPSYEAIKAKQQLVEAETLQKRQASA